MAKETLHLPEPWPDLPNSPPGLLAWASEATKHHIVGTRRPGRHEHAGLTVQLVDDAEIYFESVAEACRRGRLFTAFLAIDGVPMPQWTPWQIGEIVGALVRAARLGREADDRETFVDLGGRYLGGCLQNGGRIIQSLEGDGGEYAAAYQLRAATKLLRGDPGERWPEVLHAPDAASLFVVRGLFLAYSKIVLGRMNRATLNEQMRRVGWDDVEWNPRPPGNWEGQRPHLRVWAIPDGWDGLWADEMPLAGEAGNNNSGPRFPDRASITEPIPGRSRSNAPARAQAHTSSTRPYGNGDR